MTATLMKAGGDGAALFDGSFLTESAIRRYRRTKASSAEAPVIDAAFSDSTFQSFVADQSAQILAKNGTSATSTGGGLAGFLALLMQYLPQIIALIMSFFGPAPAPAVITV